MHWTKKGVGCIIELRGKWKGEERGGDGIGESGSGSEEPVTWGTWDEAMAREVWRPAGKGVVSGESEAAGAFNYR